MSKPHGERAHSKFSASASERWLSCPGSVALSEGLPDQNTEASLEGTLAHEVLETLCNVELSGNDGAEVEKARRLIRRVPTEMYKHCLKSSRWLFEMKSKNPHADFMVETRVYLSFIHPEMFGTFDGAIVDYFGTLHIYDYKYGKHYVSPNQNSQMIFYAIGIAHEHNWNFKRVRLWIDQPRSGHYSGPRFWETDVATLKKYVEKFQRGVERVEKKSKTYVTGDYCFFCKAKKICPEQNENREKKLLAVFTDTTLKK